MSLTNVSYEDAGKYTCVAGNYLGIMAKSVWLFVVPGKSIMISGMTRVERGEERALEKSVLAVFVLHYGYGLNVKWRSFPRVHLLLH